MFMMKGQRSRHIQQCRTVLCACGLLVASVVLVVVLKVFIGYIENVKQEARSICMSTPRWYTQASHDFSCQAGSYTLKQRLQLMMEISAALNKTTGLHWLCYGTLWAVIRGNTLLDYDKDGDICTMDVSLGQLEHIITRLPGNVRYTQNFTSFHVWRDLAEVEITSFVYSSMLNDNTDEHLIVREGYRHPLVSRSCVPEAFPDRFIKSPLQHKALNGVYFPVPKDSYEIQMYIYPDNWYHTVKPVGCG